MSGIVQYLSPLADFLRKLEAVVDDPAPLFDHPAAKGATLSRNSECDARWQARTEVRLDQLSDALRATADELASAHQSDDGPRTGKQTEGDDDIHPWDRPQSTARRQRLAVHLGYLAEAVEDLAAEMSAKR